MRLFAKSFLLTLILTASLIYPLQAQTSNYAFRGQIIEPVFTILDLKKNDLYNGSIKYTNDSDLNDVLKLDVQVLDFKVGPNGSDKNEITGLPPQASLASWITIPFKQISLKKGESITVPFNIKVPANAEYGGKYASISFQKSTPTSTTDQVPLLTRVQHTILVNIEGQRIEKLEIANFKSDKSFYDDEFSLFPELKEKTTNVEFTTEIKNIGNVHISPRGKVSVSGGWIGGGAEIDFNPANKSSLGYVLPDKDIARKFTTKWEDSAFRIGPYKAVLTLEYESNGQMTSTTSIITFWIFPWKAIVATLGLILLIVLIIMIYKRIKRRIRSKKKKNQKRNNLNNNKQKGSKVFYKKSLPSQLQSLPTDNNSNNSQRVIDA